MAIFRSGQKNRAFRDVRQAYKPIRQGNATAEQGTAFTNLRDQNSGLLDKGINRLGRRGNRLTSQIRDLKSQQRSGMGDFSSQISDLRSRRKQTNQRKQNLLGMQAYQAPEITPAVEPEVDPAIDRAKELMIPQFDWTQKTGSIVEPDVENSLMYKNALKDGFEQIDNAAAARGFGRSPAALELRNDFQQELRGRENERQQDVFDRQRELEHNTKLSQANQMIDLALGSANLSAQQKNALMQNKISLLNTMMNSNAFSIGAGAAGDVAGNHTGLANSLSSLAQNAYATSVPSGGGGGGAYVAPFPGAPDFSGANGFDAIAGGASSGDYLNSIVKGIASLF